MPECIIHIGMHKTGSTSIQKSLKGFEDQHFRYADLGRYANHSIALSYVFYPQKIDRNSESPHQIQEAIESANSLLDKAIRKEDGRHLIISGEGIIGFDQSALEQLRDRIAPHFSRLRVVGYVRPPAGYMSSIFQQRLKKCLPSLKPEDLYPNYRERFEKFDLAFGTQSVQLWKFDPANFPNRCVVSDFCSRLQIHIPESRILRDNDAYTLAITSLQYVQRLTATQLGFSGKAGDPKHLNMALAVLGKERFRLSPELTLPFLATRHDDITWMEQRLGQFLQEDLGASRPGDILSPADFLKIAVEAIPTLRALLGKNIPKNISADPIEEAAQLFQALKLNIKPNKIEKWMHSARCSYHRLVNSLDK